MRNRNTPLRAEQGLTAPFLRLAATRRLKLNTWILAGLLYPVRFGGFFIFKNTKWRYTFYED